LLLALLLLLFVAGYFATRVVARTLRLPSGAGHDAMVLAHHVPAAMLFVPSRGGLSHTPEEFSAPEHCELGARVLARTVRALILAG